MEPVGAAVAEDLSDFQKASEAMKAAFQNLEKGNHREALNHVERAIASLSKSIIIIMVHVIIS